MQSNHLFFTKVIKLGNRLREFNFRKSNPAGNTLFFVDVTDDRHRGRLDRAGAQSLQGPEGDQRRHAPGDATEDRAEDEGADPDQHDRLSAVLVTELGEDRYRHRLSQQEDREEPRELGEAAEIVDDGGDRGGQDGGVDGDEPDAEHDRQQDWSALRAETYVGSGNRLRHV